MLASSCFCFDFACVGSQRVLSVRENYGLCARCGVYYVVIVCSVVWSMCLCVREREERESVCACGVLCSVCACVRVCMYVYACGVCMCVYTHTYTVVYGLHAYVLLCTSPPTLPVN